MSTRHQPLDDPILASLPEIRGRRVLKPCVLYARLGRGGMGAVYLGKHLTLMQKQVVKCLWLMGSGNPSDSAFVDRFQQEARIAAEMTHQNLVRVTHVDRLGDLPHPGLGDAQRDDCARRRDGPGAMVAEPPRTGAGRPPGRPDPADGFLHAAPVGSFPDGASPYGVLDLAGNVWEWTADAPRPDEVPGLDASARRIARGGSWASSAPALRVTHRNPLPEDGAYPDVGFRCAYDAP